jgi:hypothetical protein
VVFSGRPAERFNRRVNLTQEFFIGKMLQKNGPGRAHGVAQAIAFADHRIDDRLFALSCLTKLDGTIGTRAMQAPQPMHVFSVTSQTDPETVTVSFESRVRTRPAAPYAWLIGFRNMLGIVGHAAKIDAVVANSTGLNLTWASLKKPSGLRGTLKNPGYFLVGRGNDGGGQGQAIGVDGNLFLPKMGSVTVTRKTFPAFGFGASTSGFVIRIPPDELAHPFRTLPGNNLH